jgi:hypothetical protein
MKEDRRRKSVDKRLYLADKVKYLVSFERRFSIVPARQHADGKGFRKQAVPAWMPFLGWW